MRTQCQLRDELQVKISESDANLVALNTAQSSLATFQSYLTPLRSLDDDRRTMIRGAFEDVFHAAWEVILPALNHDLSSEILAKVGGELHKIPLPPSNSVAAKHMRAAAGLMACGKALAKHVFRDTFLTQNDELHENLEFLAAYDLMQHAYLRGALAKALPTTQARNRERSIDQAVAEIVTTIGHWTPDERAVKLGLRRMCEKALAVWQLAQQAEDRIWPEFIELQEDWLQLPVPKETQELATGNSIDKKQPKGQKKLNVTRRASRPRLCRAR